MVELPGSPVTILYVDEDPEFCGFVAKVLERENDRFTVETVTSVSDGLERLDDGVDCVVSDYDMPGADGVEFLEAVRAERPDLPFVLYTGEGDESVASEAISAGVTDYVRKQSDIDHYAVLANRVENAVERYRANQRADRTKRRLEELAESTTDCLWMFDRDWEELLFVSGYERMWDRSADALEDDPQDFLEGIHPEDRDFVERSMARLSNGESVDVEYRIERGDGEVGWIWVKGQPVFEGGEVARVVGFARDITERKERERDLELKTTAMDRAPGGITITDYTREDNPVVYTNDRFTELTGYASEAIHGRNHRILQGEETGEEPVAELRAAVEEGRRTTVELRNYTADGEEFWNEVRITPIRDESGAVTHFVGFQQDVTDRKERERELRRQNERLDEFASLVSHDLRNPLNVAIGGVDLIREDLGDDNEHVERTERALERMESLIEDMLLLARQGEDVTDPEPVPLDDAGRRCWRHVETPAAKLVVDADLTVRADRTRLHHLFENLFRNAVEHGSTSPDSQARQDDGRASSSEPSVADAPEDAVEHGSTSPDSQARQDADQTRGNASQVSVTVTVDDLESADGFYVEDDGPGIPPDEREDVFEPGVSTADDGTGFGLSIAESVADAHDWEIDVTAGTDGGARFEVTDVDVIE